MHKSSLILALAVASACARPAAYTPSPAARAAWLLPGEMPDPAPREFLGLIGEYDTPRGLRLVLEDSGRLWLADTVRQRVPLIRIGDDLYGVDPSRRDTGLVRFERDATGRATAILSAPGPAAPAVRMPRRNIEPLPGTNQLRITPLRPVDELRTEALAASPPAEHGDFRKPDLVELTSLDPSIKLEIRYATTNNFLGTRFYTQARAF